MTSEKIVNSTESKKAIENYAKEKTPFLFSVKSRNIFNTLVVTDKNSSFLEVPFLEDILLRVNTKDSTIIYRQYIEDHSSIAFTTLLEELYTLFFLTILKSKTKNLTFFNPFCNYGFHWKIRKN